MKKMMIFTGCVAALLAGCKPANDKVPQAEQSPAPRAESAARNPDVDRSTTQQKLTMQLNDLDAKMAALKARAQRAGDQAKAEWEARRPQLEAQRESAAKKLDELKASSKETWAETSKKAEAAFGELEKGFKEAWAKLRE